MRPWDHFGAILADLFVSVFSLFFSWKNHAMVRMKSESWAGIPTSTLKGSIDLNALCHSLGLEARWRICIYIYIHIFVNIYIYICFVPLNIYIYIYMYIYIYVFSYMYIYIYKYMSEKSALYANHVSNFDLLVNVYSLSQILARETQFL